MEGSIKSKNAHNQLAAYTNLDRFLSGIDDSSKIIPMLDGIISEDLKRHGNDFGRLVRSSDAMRRFSRQFKSRIIFAILRSFPEGESYPSYKKFIETFCCGMRDFCSEGTYVRHRAAEEFINRCDSESARNYFKSLPEGKIRKYIKSTRGLEDKGNFLREFYETLSCGKEKAKKTDAIFDELLDKYPIVSEVEQGNRRPLKSKKNDGARENLDKILTSLEGCIRPDSEEYDRYKEVKNSFSSAFAKLEKLMEKLSHADGK